MYTPPPVSPMPPRMPYELPERSQRSDDHYANARHYSRHFQFSRFMSDDLVVETARKTGPFPANLRSEQ